MIASDNTVSGTFVYGLAYLRGFVRGRRFIVDNTNATFFDTLSAAMTVLNGLLDTINWTIHHSSALTHAYTDAQTHACTTNTTVTLSTSTHTTAYTFAIAVGLIGPHSCIQYIPTVALFTHIFSFFPWFWKFRCV